MTPAEHILTTGKCLYCLTQINDNDRCGCDGETIWYLTQAVEILCEALEPLANAWDFQKKYLPHNFAEGRLDDRYIWKPSSNVTELDGISFGDAKRAYDTLEQVEITL